MMTKMLLILGVLLLLSSLLPAQENSHPATSRKPRFGNHGTTMSRFHEPNQKKPPWLPNSRLSFRDRYLLSEQYNLPHPNISSPVHPFLSDTVQEEWIKQYSSALLPGQDVAMAMTMDIQGNLYVTGYTPREIFGTDFYTIKYDLNGNMLWSARYAEGAENIPHAIAVDNNGNVYVTGGSIQTGNLIDFATVKYNSSGIQQWAARYNGAQNMNDEAIGLAVDEEGNVYVTGYSESTENYWDFTTIKYDSAGNQQWLVSYNGTASFFDMPRAISLDNAGNIYVVGYSSGDFTFTDYTLIKYSPAGLEDWVVNYDGPAHTYDDPSSMAIDSEGNIYITGFSTDSSSFEDFTTIKYDSAGNQQWVARYNSGGSQTDIPAAIKLDNQGNLCITGYTFGLGIPADYLTIKYDTNGNLLWATSFNSSTNHEDFATGLAIDMNGTIYVTGYSWISGNGFDYTTVAYTSNGTEKWMADYSGGGSLADEPIGVEVDMSGNVYVTGFSTEPASDEDFATVKYDSTGNEQWVVRYDGLHISIDKATAMTIDDFGNVYVAGNSEDPASKSDYLVVKYKADGVQLWEARYNGTGNDIDQITAIEADADGNVYVTGRSMGTTTNFDYATVKFDSGGIQQWVAHYNGPGNGVDEAKDLAIDTEGNIYVTGQSEGSGTDADYTTIKYNSSGVEQWVARYNSPQNSFDRANAITVDSHGNVYITGVGSSKYITLKYNTDGIQQWGAVYTGPGFFYDEATALGVDGNGNVYVTGLSWSNNTMYDYATIKYDSTGIQQWVRRYTQQVMASDEAKALAVDDNGNVYVTGSSPGTGTGVDYVTIKYNSAGVQQWLARFTGLGMTGEQWVTGLALDNSNNVYVTGFDYTEDGGYEFATVKYDASGTEQWVAAFNGLGYSDDLTSALRVDPTGNVFVTGSTSTPLRSVFTTIKYIQTPTGVVATPLGVPKNFRLYQNYPNPFNPTTTISFDLPRPSFVTLNIYDVTGRLVRTLENKRMVAGVHLVFWDGRDTYGQRVSSGIYLYRLQAGNHFSETRKMVLLK